MAASKQSHNAAFSAILLGPYIREMAMKTRNTRLMITAACVVAALIALSPSGRSASKGFNGKWKGEIQFPAAGGRGRGGAPQTQGQKPPVQQFVQRGGGGPRGGDGGFPPSGVDRGNFGPQKVSVNIKTKDDDTKAVGNITIGETTDDIKDGTIEGDRIAFKAGTSSAVYQYSGTRDGDQIMMTRTSPASGERGGQSIQFVLKRS